MPTCYAAVRLGAERCFATNRLSLHSAPDPLAFDSPVLGLTMVKRSVQSSPDRPPVSKHVHQICVNFVRFSCSSCDLDL